MSREYIQSAKVFRLGSLLKRKGVITHRLSSIFDSHISSKVRIKFLPLVSSGQKLKMEVAKCRIYGCLGSQLALELELAAGKNCSLANANANAILRKINVDNRLPKNLNRLIFLSAAFHCTNCNCKCKCILLSSSSQENKAVFAGISEFRRQLSNPTKEAINSCAATSSKYFLPRRLFH